MNTIEEPNLITAGIMGGNPHFRFTKDLPFPPRRNWEDYKDWKPGPRDMTCAGIIFMHKGMLWRAKTFFPCNPTLEEIQTALSELDARTRDPENPAHSDFVALPDEPLRAFHRYEYAALTDEKERAEYKEIWATCFD